MIDMARHTAFERLLSAFTRVHAGEGRCIAVLCAQAFLLMVAYYLVRPVREALILTEGGAELRSYAVGVQAVLLLAVIPMYGWLVRHVVPGRVFQRVNAFFAINLVVFFLLAQAGCRLGFAFFIWVSLFGVMAVTQFWAFATDLFNVASGQRLFGVIAIGVSAGAWAGSQLAAAGFETLGPGGLMLAAAGVLSASIRVSGHARAAVPEGARSRALAPAAEALRPAARWLGGFAVIAKSPYLAGIAALVVLLNWITSTGDYVLSSWLVELARREAPGGESLFIGRFMGNFSAMVTLMAFAIQLLLVSRIILFAGLARALLVTPLAFAAGYLVVGVIPVFLLLQSVLVVQRSLDYSLLNTTRHALLLPGSRDAKYQAKTAIDTFFFRAGDLLSTLSVFVGLRVFDNGRHQFVWLVFVLSLTMALVAWLVGREYARRHEAARESRAGDLGVGGGALLAQ
ncbi:MAG: NTP/NDP exchange transporter [Gammaproteobacteria bacterium]